MTDEELKDAAIKKMEQQYFLIPKNNLILFLGGLVGFVILSIYSSYKGAISAVESTGARIAIEEIEKDKVKAAKGQREIESFARDIKNGKLREKMITLLKSDPTFLAQIKGNSGPKGEKGEKGDLGISTWEYGEYIKLNNLSQKRVAWMGSSSGNTGIIALYDRSGNEVLRITTDGIYVLNNGQWVELYVKR